MPFLLSYSHFCNSKDPFTLRSILWYGTDKIGTRTTFFGSWTTCLEEPHLHYIRSIFGTVPFFRSWTT
jgi:hypothetical protein